MVIAHLRDGSIVEGVLGAWADDWAEIDGRKWTGVAFIEVLR